MFGFFKEKFENSQVLAQIFGTMFCNIVLEMQILIRFITVKQKQKILLFGRLHCGPFSNCCARFSSYQSAYVKGQGNVM